MARLAIFDLDGTLLDTLGDLTASANAALAANHLPTHSRDTIRQFVGNGIRKLVECACPANLAPELLDRVHADFHRHYARHCADTTAPYPGIPRLLDELGKRGIRTAVVSNKADFAVQQLCARFFPRQFDAIAGEREGVRRKPAPDTVNAVLARLGMTAADAVYIGDSDVDIATARNAGVPCIAVTWGFRDRATLEQAGATLFADDTSLLLEAIRNA
ncbi:MAG: HAD family hydrolase [Oligosphaeraceae bacterium]